MLLGATALLSACSNGNATPTPTATPTPAPTPTPTPTPVAATRTIIMVWDGLRPDDVNAVDTPNLFALQQAGVAFNDNHSTYPTFTMMNGASFATGSFPRTAGFYGNTFWTPPQGAGNTIPAGRTAAGGTQSYVQPVFTEDYQVLTTLNDYYGGQLLLVKSLFQTAQDAKMVTATIGKSGAAYIQDLGKGGFFLDENTVQPRSLVAELQGNGTPLPLNTTFNYSGTDAVTLTPTNGNPTARAGYVTFNTTAYDPAGVQTVAARDSTDTTQGAPEDAANRYMLSVFTNYILPNKRPMLSLIWFRTPDNVEHGYGPGTANARAGLRSQDQRLGELQASLRAQGLDASTNIVVVSDHAHSSVSGPLSLYPLRTIVASGTAPTGPIVNGATSGTSAATLGGVNTASGFSFSGDVRSADLLTYRGFAAYDGAGCSTSAMYGLTAGNVPTVPLRLDAAGTLCGAAGTKYQAVSGGLTTPVASFIVPAPGALPANGIVVAANGGSDYFYVPSHDPALIQRLVAFLQRREEYGAVFVDSRYGSIPGTLTMGQVNLENAKRQNNGQPDVVVTFNWDETASIQGKAGIEFESTGGQRGMHGSFGPTDVRNTLIAGGPSFLKAARVTNPTGNVDVAPTVAYVLGLSMPAADGRIINEALVSPSSRTAPTVAASNVTSSTASGLVFETPTDPTGNTRDAGRTAGTYAITLAVKDYTVDGKTYRYFDFARATRN